MMDDVTLIAVVLATAAVCTHALHRLLSAGVDEVTQRPQIDVEPEPYEPITTPEPPLPPLEVSNSADDLRKRYVFVKSVPAVCPDCERLVIHHEKMQPGAYVLCSGMIGLVPKE